MIPEHPKDMHVDWLCDKLGGPVGGLNGFDFKPIGTGQVGDSYRLVLDWNTPNAGLPGSVVAKCPAQDEKSRDTARKLHNYEVEVRWYQEYAHQANIRTPKCLHVDMGADTSNFALIMEDVAPAQQGNQLAGCDVDSVRLVLDELAHLHAFRWDDASLLNIDWLNYNKANRELVGSLVPQLYPEWRNRYSDRISQDILEMGDAFIERYDRYGVDQVWPIVIAHGDCRLDNVLFSDPDGRAIIVDWQTITAGTPMADVAYLLGTSFHDPAMRLANEEALIAYYLTRLSAHGVGDYENAYRDYRYNAFGGFLMAVIASMLVERTKRGDEMFAVMAERSGAQAIALDSLSLV